MTKNIKPDNKCDNNDKVVIDDTIRKRLKGLQREKGKTNGDISTETGMGSTYSNIFHTNGSLKYIKLEHLKTLAKYFDCTTDYIIGASDNMKMDKSGKLIIVNPISFDKDIHLEEVIKQLRKNDKLLKSLYFLFTKLPDADKSGIINGFITTISVLENSSLYKYKDKDNISEKHFNSIINAFHQYDSTYFEYVTKYGDAVDLYNRHQYKKSFKQCLEVLNDSLQDFMLKDTARDCYELMLNIEKKWRHYPTSLNDFMAEFEQYLSNKIHSLNPKALKLLREYLDNN